MGILQNKKNWKEKKNEKKKKERKKRFQKKKKKKKKKKGEKEVLQFYIYKLPIDRPAAVTGSNNDNNLPPQPAC